jgi:hypothetical protein
MLTNGVIRKVWRVAGSPETQEIANTPTFAVDQLANIVSQTFHCIIYLSSDVIDRKPLENRCRDRRCKNFEGSSST